MLEYRYSLTHIFPCTAKSESEKTDILAYFTQWFIMMSLTLLAFWSHLLILTSFLVNVSILHSVFSGGKKLAKLTRMGQYALTWIKCCKYSWYFSCTEKYYWYLMYLFLKVLRFVSLESKPILLLWSEFHNRCFFIQSL